MGNVVVTQPFHPHEVVYILVMFYSLLYNCKFGVSKLFIYNFLIYIFIQQWCIALIKNESKDFHNLTF